MSRSRHVSFVILCTIGSLCWALRVAAQGGEFGARGTYQRERLVATHGEDPTASGTALDVQDRVAVPRALGDIVREAPGTQVRSTGGVGAYASVGLRGAEGHETLVLLDEIPLVAPDGGAFDLGSFPAELFERIDVFRSGAPVWLGSGAIGGVVRLIPRRSDTARYDFTGKAGSFGAWQLEAGQGARSGGRLSLRSRALIRGAQNDFPYHDDRGTRFDGADDRELRRKNAELTDATGFWDLSAPLWGGQLHAVVLANARTAGEPGPGSQPTPNIHRQRLRALAGLAYERHWGSQQRLQLVASTSGAHDRYTDLYGELGVSRRWNTRDASYRAFVRAADTLKLTPWLDASVIGSYALDHYAWSDQFSFPAPAPSTRHGLAAALELAARGRLGAVGFELRPSARVEWSHTELHSGSGATGSFDATQAVTAPTARLGVGISPLRFVALSGSIATGVRLPTMFELFGDRGLVLPAPSLEPVRSTTYDAGLTLQHAQALLRGALELRGFIQKRRDEIGSYRTAQFQIAHVNLSEVQQRGFELGLRAVLFELLYLNGAATYMKTEDALGNRLPLRPLWSAFARPELRVRFEGGVASSAGASVELSHRSFVFADRANLGVIAACTTTSLSASLGLFRDHLRVTGRIEDVADARCTDLIGFPLPGRTLLLSLTYQEMTDDHA